MTRSNDGVAHHFTVDVEEYFHVTALEPWVSRDAWSSFESRVAAAMGRLLDLLAEHEVRATMFVLGWLAERQQALVKEMAAAGHEIASHGWDHRRVTHQEPSEFRDSVRRTKRFLEDLTGQSVLGFRAPSFSIIPGKEWALDILIEEGHLYDSSLFPVRRARYGYPGGRRDPHWLDRPSGRIAEIPPATLRRGGVNIPAGGGAYLRLLPYGLVRRALLESSRRRVPATFYVHPWELDPDQPRLRVPAHVRLRHYGGLDRTEARLRRLLAEFRFGPIVDSLTTMAAA